MSSDRRSERLWTIVAAVGGLLSGIAAVLGLFIARPEAIAYFIPVQVLQQVVAEHGETSSAPSSGAVVPQQQGEVVAASSPQAIAKPATEATSAPLQVRDLGGGVSVTLVSLVEDQNRYVVTLRFENSSANELGIAVLQRAPYQGDLVLTDGAGGSCSMGANGEGWGTLDIAEVHPSPLSMSRGDEFRTIGAGARVQQTVFFNKMRCATAVSATDGLAISGVLVISDGAQRRSAPISFEEINLLRR